MNLDILNTAISRRRFLQVSGVTGAAAAAGLGLEQVTGQAVTDAKATVAESKTVITKSVCHQCPARCGIDVYTTDGRVHRFTARSTIRSPTASCARRDTSAPTSSTTPTASKVR